jgi:L-threonylcarbamoyladenylate synthase
MRILSWNNPETIDYIEKELHSGRVVLAEGDTVLGLLADVSEKGLAQLDQIKSRSKKPYLILIGSPQKVFDFIEIDPKKVIQTEKLINICWPGPVTLIFRAKAGLVSSSKSADGTIAIRVPDHAGLLALLAKIDALFSTSANSSGEPVPSSIEAVDSAIKSSVACIIENPPRAKSQSSLPSTIIDCTGDRLVVVREGAFDISKLVNLMGN